MFKIIELFYRVRILLLFILLEIVAISIRTSKNKDKLIAETSDSFSYSVLKFTSSFYDYFKLKEINRDLMHENESLKNQLESLHSSKEYILSDTNFIQYDYLAAKVINNSILKERNYITINKGSNDGIKSSMAIVNNNGVVGIVLGTSPNYSRIISVLNTNIKISAKLKNKLEFGSITWDGKSYEYLQLKEIPTHIEVNKGDTVVTNAYSSIFPENIMIGIVEKIEKSIGSNFLNIEVKTSTNFSNLSYVYAIENKLKEEKTNLENETAENR